jgi:sodium/bile acid cotransporter 7
VKRALLDQWFLLSLAIVLSLGLLAPHRFAKLADAAGLRDLIVAIVLFVTAFGLETGAMWRAVRRPAAALIGVAMNFGVVPLVAWAVSGLLRGDLAIGLLVIAAAPCTLAAAAVWTRRAGGSDAIALVVTIITNVSCFVITPLWLVTTTGSAGIRLEMSSMIGKLGYLVVLPMIAAQILRQRPALGHWATSHLLALSVVAQSGILVMVLMGSVQCGLNLSALQWGQELDWWDLALVIPAVLGVHLLVLVLGHLTGHLVGIDRAGRIAMGFAGSQKTLTVGLHVVLTYFAGLAVLPVVAYHVGQLLVDTLIADGIRRQYRRSSSAETASPPVR